MPVNKNAMARYRIIDKMLSDPNRDYTTEEIAREVTKKKPVDSPKVTLRMIQKDIKALQDDFGKEMIRNAGGRGTVKYADQSEPLFYQELTSDEEEVLREVLRSLGQFDGLDNFMWLELLKKKLDMPAQGSQRPLICFSKSDGLQMPPTLLGRLFTAISRRQPIRFTYTKFSDDPNPRQYEVYPYQLKQYNGRWYLLCNVLGNEEFPFNPEFIATFPLDRISEKFEYLEDTPFIDTPVDLTARFDEIIGVTLYTDRDIEDIYFAVRPDSVPYVRSKFIHATQIELDSESEKEFIERYPSLSDCKFFSIECRPNNELYNVFSSFAGRVILLEPLFMREELAARMKEASSSYDSLK